VDQIGDMIFESGTDTDTVLAKYENHALGSSVENLILGTDIVAGAGNSLGNSLTGNSLANSLFGDVGNDTIVAQDGADTLNGGTGDDSMAGGLGDDFYLIDSLNDTIWESLSQGTDSVLANISGYTLAANVEYLELSGNFVAGTGNSFSNTLLGNASGNILDGGAGIDSMAGGAGNDTYFVDNTADQVGESSGAGTDTVVATVTAYTLADNVEALILSGSVATGTGNSISNTITGNASNNTLDGGEGSDTLIGGLGNDYYIIDNAADVLVENSSEGTDSVHSNISTYTLAVNFEHLILGTGLTGIGNSLGNSLIGNADSNTLDGQTGSDTLVGGLGNDDYTIDDLTDKVIESTSAGDDRVTTNVNNYVLAANVEALLLGTSILNGTGNSLDNSIIGNALANSLSGAAGNDTLTAGAQNDTINGGAGDDSMAGGTGDDLYYADSLLDQIVEADSEGTDSVLASIESYVLAANIELLELSAGIVTGIGNSTVNTLLGNTIANSLAGDSGNDTLWGLAGNDTLDGGAGDDSLIGGSGDDFYIVDSTLDTILELSAGGTDTVFANLATYTINNQIENLVLGVGGVSGIGSSGANSILGNASGNSLDGGAGIDTLTGAGGNDTYFVSDSADLVIEEGDAGIDIVFSVVSSYTLTADVEGLVLTDSATIGYGNASDNTLTGNTLLANSLFGADGDDSLFGGSGSDTLNGGTGADSLIGGLGNDYFIVDNINDQVSDTGGTDSILVNVLGGFTLAGGSTVENLILGTGDQITGNASNNSILGNASTNTLDGGGGTDTLIGGNGNDYYYIDSIDDFIIEDLNGGTDTVSVSFSGYTLGANIENLALSDSAANASLIGGAGNNSLVGNSFDNTIDGGLGSDTMVGGTGNDYYVVDNLGDRIVEVSGAGTDSVLSNVISFTLSSDIEVLILGNYAVTGVGSSLNNTLIGNSKANSLNGGDGADSLFSGGGNDTLNGGAGIDIMVGGSGNDYFVIDNASDSIVSGGGTDGIIVQYNNYTLGGGGWNILVLDGATALQGYGSSGNDTITGSIYNNTLNGNGGDDRLLGLTGHDYYIVDSAGDVVIEAASEGTDSVESRLSTYTLGGNVERLILGSGALDGIGNSLANILIGNANNNSLTGAAGTDSLTGGDGNDTLLGALATSSGGRGEIDTLTGGSGNDVFVLGSASGCLYDDGISTSLGTTDYAYITDFIVGTDKLQLLGSDANYRLGSHTVTGLTDYQGLFRELGTTDELVAIIQTNPLTTKITTLDSTTVNWV
jgi:Ca2+-binding RTX toxin-like protein